MNKKWKFILTLIVNYSCKKKNRLLSKLKRMRQDQIKNARKIGVYMLINEYVE